jgi:hypothetical protein
VSNVNETKETKIARKGVLIALGIICIILAACLGGVIAAYTLMINDKDNTISLLRSQISQLNSNVTSLRNELNDLLSVAGATYVDIKEINLNPSAWVNKTVVVEGNLTGPLVFITENAPPWNYELSSNGTRIGVLWNRDDVYNSANVRVSGVVRQGRRAGGLLEPPPICYYIEAERIDML